MRHNDLEQAARDIVAYNNDPGDCPCKGCEIIRHIRAALSPPPRVMVLGDLYEFDHMVLGDSDLAPDFSCPLWLWGSPGWTS